MKDVNWALICGSLLVLAAPIMSYFLDPVPAVGVSLIGGICVGAGLTKR